MSDLQALHIFVRKPVSDEMITFLVQTTNSVIHVGPSCQGSLPTPPDSPNAKIPSLHTFIKKLIKYSNVPTSTLMSSLVYLTRLRELLPPNAVGMPTTRHRIFLGALILAAKNLNDSSPLNKHWCRYTEGLLSLEDVNMLEIEMIEGLGWSNIRISNADLIHNLSHFLEPIKWKLRHKNEAKLSSARAKYLKHSRSTTKISKLLSPSSPTKPLFSFISTPPLGKKPLTQSRRSSPATPDSYTYFKSPDDSVEFSTTSVPSLVSSGSTTSYSNSTLSSILTESNGAANNNMTTLGGSNLKTLHLTEYYKKSRKLEDKENTSELHFLNGPLAMTAGNYL